jgi:hypothetical protein
MKDAAYSHFSEEIASTDSTHRFQKRSAEQLTARLEDTTEMINSYHRQTPNTSLQTPNFCKTDKHDNRDIPH